jgi:hypothetical protein
MVRFVGALFLGAVTALSQEATQQALSQKNLTSDWGLSRWSDVRRGQVSVIHRAEGDDLQVRSLLTTPRAVYSGPRRSIAPAYEGNCFLAASFDSGIINRLGGHFSVFAAAPSSARVTLQKWDDGRRALTVHYDRQAGGFCGVWAHLFDFTLPEEERVYFDSTPFSHLTFWVRGQQGGERIRLKVADANWEQKQDALPAGEISSFVTGKTIQQTWQRVVVPLAALSGRLDRRALATLAFEAIAAGRGSIAIQDIAFCKNSEPMPAFGTSPPKTTAERKLNQALWVWNTAEILASKEQQQELVDFAKRHGFTDLFLQLQSAGQGPTPQGEIAPDPAAWRSFLSLLSRSGLRGHALDGFNRYALREFHEPVLRTVENVIRYNRSVQPDEAFQGLHYDVEPYLIAGFSGPARGRILGSYLELLQKIVSKTRPAGIRFGVDLPFWFDGRDEFTGQRFSVEFRGTSKPVSEHVIDLVDTIAVMDYRTYAFGADGVLALARSEIEYAAKSGKRVFVGLETTHLPDEDLMDFEGPPSKGIPDRAPGRAIVLIPDGDAAAFRLVEPSEWPGLRAAAGSLLWWPVARLIRVPGDKLTFERSGVEALRRTMDESEPELREYSSFAGFAIHDYLGYRRLSERRP